MRCHSKNFGVRDLCIPDMTEPKCINTLSLLIHEKLIDTQAGQTKLLLFPTTCVPNLTNPYLKG